MAYKKGYPKTRAQDIHFRKSLFRFSVAFVFVLFSGLLSRFLIYQFPLEAKLSEALQLSENPGLEINKPRFRFRWGWLPVLGLEIKRLDWRDPLCASRQVSVQDALVILGMGPLLQGELKPTHLHIDFLDMTFSGSCGAMQNSLLSESSTRRGSEKNKVDRPKVDLKVLGSEEGLKKLFSDHLEKISNFGLRRAVVDRFRLQVMENLTRSVGVEGQASFKRDSQWKANLRLQNFYWRDHRLDFLRARVDLSLDRHKLHFDARSVVREGDIQISGDLENKESFPTQLKVNFHKVPLSPFAELVSKDFQVRYLWLNCKGRVQSSYEKLFQALWDLKDCNVDGPFGSAFLTDLKGSLSGLSSANIKIDRMNLDEILREKRGFLLSGVFENYGLLSAHGRLKDEDWLVEGTLREAELIFSHKNHRDIQRVESLPFRFEQNKASWKARVESIVLEKGHFLGRLSLDKKKDSSGALGKISIHKLRFDPQIYKLVLNSEPTDLKIYGKFLWQESQLKSWSAWLATKELKSSDYSLKNFKAKGHQNQGEEPSVQITATEGHLEKSSTLLNWVSPTLLSESLAEPMNFREVSARLKISDNREITWTRGYARFKNSWQLSSEGRRSSDHGVEGWLQWDRADGRYMKWKYQGSFFEGRWEPVTPWVKQWLENHKDFLEQHPSVNYEKAEKVSLLRRQVTQ